MHAYKKTETSIKIYVMITYYQQAGWMIKKKK